MTFTDTPPYPSTPLPEGSARSATDAAKAALHDIGDEASAVMGAAQDKAMDKLENGKDAATKTLQEFAGAIRKAGDELAQHDQSMAGQMVRKAADGLEQFARSVSEKPPSEMLHAVRDFGRENPAVFAAGSVLLGLAIGRFARSSEVHGSAQGAPSNDGASQSSTAYMRRPASGVEARVHGDDTPVPGEAADGGFTRSPAPLGVEI